MKREWKETLSSGHSGQDEIEKIDKGKLRRDYIRIPKDMRRKLLEIIERGQLTIKAAAIRLGINYSSAKSIVKIFRQQKRIDVMEPNIYKHAISKKKEKVNRFTAKRTHLAIDNPLLITSNQISNSNPNMNDIQPEINSTIDLLECKPIFDFSVYTSLILTRCFYS